MSRIARSLVFLILVLVLEPARAGAQAPQSAPPDAPQAREPGPQEETIDIFDVWRQVRNKEPDPPEEAADYRKPMVALAPVIGVKPSAGVSFGVAGNIAFYRGDPSTTRISSVVTSATFSTEKQTSIKERFTLFTRDDRWRFEGDHRFEWTSLDTYSLGMDAEVGAGIEARFDFFRAYQTAYVRVARSLFAGGGLYFDNHTNVGPAAGAEEAWASSPYVEYSETYGLPIDSQISAGPSLDLLWDDRDNFINADRGWLVKASYRKSFEGFLGGDSTWEKLTVDARTYVPLTPDLRHKLAFWAYTDHVVGGVAPYLDLPASGQDAYGRSARGYHEGQFRGPKLAYGEVEYRGTLMRNGLLGMVLFLNATTVTTPDGSERLFDSVAIGGGAGVRLLINKRSKTNLCFDVGFGERGSSGVYVGVQEVF
ncbi:MAG TPA: BamA/TamA family outer membrane protein [Vicinamibacterales bacterium]|nr:BamA/TamA family outer membrane protein [Vicinamibacterales bacterium]